MQRIELGLTVHALWLRRSRSTLPLPLSTSGVHFGLAKDAPTHQLKHPQETALAPREGTFWLRRLRSTPPSPLSVSAVRLGLAADAPAHSLGIPADNDMLKGLEEQIQQLAETVRTPPHVCFREQLRDLDRRVAAMKTEEEALSSRLGPAGADAAALTASIEKRRREVAELERQRATFPFCERGFNPCFSVATDTAKLELIRATHGANIDAVTKLSSDRAQAESSLLLLRRRVAMLDDHLAFGLSQMDGMDLSTWLCDIGLCEGKSVSSLALPDLEEQARGFLRDQSVLSLQKAGAPLTSACNLVARLQQLASGAPPPHCAFPSMSILSWTAPQVEVFVKKQKAEFSPLVKAQWDGAILAMAGSGQVMEFVPGIKATVADDFVEVVDEIKNAEVAASASPAWLKDWTCKSKLS